MRIFTLCILALLLLTTASVAADISLAWDASVSAGVTNYRVYWGNAARTYQNSITIGNVLTYKMLNIGVGTWYIAVTAIDANANESGYSNEVSTVIGGPPAAPGNLFRLPPAPITNTNPPPKVVP